jgi:hypothetical protein
VSSERFDGGCHCGAVRFRVRVDTLEALDCNCSICAMKGFLHCIVPAEAFELVSGQDVLREYRFGTGIARHRFCGVCGIHAFYVPRSHPDGIDVNVRCLDGNPVARFTITPFDGRDWDESAARLSTREAHRLGAASSTEPPK